MQFITFRGKHYLDLKVQVSAAVKLVSKALTKKKNNIN